MTVSGDNTRPARSDTWAKVVMWVSLAVIAAAVSTMLGWNPLKGGAESGTSSTANQENDTEYIATTALLITWNRQSESDHTLLCYGWRNARQTVLDNFYATAKIKEFPLPVVERFYNAKCT